LMRLAASCPFRLLTDRATGALRRIPNAQPQAATNTSIVYRQMRNGCNHGASPAKRRLPAVWFAGAAKVVNTICRFAREEQNHRHRHGSGGMWPATSREEGSCGRFAVAE